MNEERVKVLNVFLLGLSFMLLFTAFQTMGNIETTVLNSAKNNASAGYVDGFHGSGYASLATIYTLFALSNWLIPPIITLLGLRLTMVLGSTSYALFIGQFIKPNDAILYSTSALLGVGAAMLWTAQGAFLTQNSDSTTMSRNSGLFWAMMQSSMLIGNTFVFFQFQGQTDISQTMRDTTTEVLFAICCSGILVMVLLRPTPWVTRNHDLIARAPDTAVQSVKKAWNLAWTPHMLKLGVAFFYSGLELTFISGVYGPSVGSTLNFGDVAKSLVGLHGIALGVGEIVGGFLFGIFGHFIVRKGRDPVIMLGSAVHCLSFFLIFLNLPNASPFGDTTDQSFITSNAYLAILCSFLLGFGDACLNTQIFSILGVVFAHDSTSAFAIFRFSQSLAAAIAFFYSDVCSLYIQLLILTVFSFLGAFCFIQVEWATANVRQLNLTDNMIEEDERRPILDGNDTGAIDENL